MKKLARIAFYGLVGIVVLIGLLAVAIKVLFPPEKARAMIETRLTAALGREVKLDQVSVSIVSGLQVDGFRVSAIPNFENGTSLSCERLSLYPRWLPLLTGKLFIKDIELIRPEATIVRSPDGSLNLTGPAPAAAPPPAASSSQTDLTAFLVSEVTIERGAFRFVDQSTAALSATLDPLNLTARHVSLAGPIEIKLSAAGTAMGINGSLETTGRVSVLKKSATLTTLTTEIGPMKLTGDGEFQFATGTVVNLHLASNEIAVKDFLRMMPSPAPPAGLAVDGAFSFDVRAQGPTDNLYLTASVAGEKLALAYGDSFRKSAGIPFSIALKASMDASGGQRIRDLAIGLAGMTLKGSGALKGAAYTLDFKSEEFSLAPVAALLPSAADYQLAGLAKVTSLHLASGAQAPIVNAMLQIRDVSAHYQGAALTELAASTIRYDNGVLDIPKLSGKLNGSPLTLTFNGRSLDTHPVITSNIEVEKLDVEKLLPADNSNKKTEGFRWFAIPEANAAPTPTAAEPPLRMDLTGTLKAGQITHSYYLGNNFVVDWNLKNVTSDLSIMNGKATLTQGKGDIRNIKKLVSLSPYTRIFLGPVLVPLLALSKLKIIDFSPDKPLTLRDVTGDYAFKNGVMVIKKFFLNGSDLDTSVTGTVGLAGEQPLNLAGSVKVSPRLIRGTVGQVFGDDAGIPTYSFTIDGTVSAPDPHWDPGQATKKAINILTDKVLEKIGGKGGNGNEAKPAEGEAGAPAKDQPSLEDTAVDIINGLFRKKK